MSAELKRTVKTQQETIRKQESIISQQRQLMAEVVAQGQAGFPMSALQLLKQHMNDLYPAGGAH